MSDYDVTYCESKARQCFRLADGCYDSAVAFTLRQIGYEFVHEALRLGADPAAMPPKWLQSAADR
jgi:hypothetical protein